MKYAQKLSVSFISVVVAATLSACGADAEAARMRAPGSDFQNAGSSGASGTSGTAATSSLPPATLCEVGPLPCYCPDGEISGTQFCDARHELGMCQCASSGTTDTGVDSEAISVCSQLAGRQDCNAKSYASAQVPASMLFVVDRSGSMACNAPPFQTTEECNADPHRLSDIEPSRWETTIGALKEAFTGLENSNATVGLSMFSTDGYCGVDSTPLVGLGPVDPTQQAALAMAMDNASPAGGTPIVGGVVLGYHHLHEELHATGNRYVVLITDGEESCGMAGDENNVEDLMASRALLLQTEVQKAREANIRTFVIGSPGSEGARGFLSQLAFEGGTARSEDCVHGDPDGDVGDCHFDLSTETDFANVLKQTLGEVSGQALACEFAAPYGANALNVNVQMSQNGSAPECLAHAAGPCDATDGWQFPVGPDGAEDTSRVLLCGAACDRLKSDPTTVVDVILGCAVLE